VAVAVAPASLGLRHNAPWATRNRPALRQRHDRRRAADPAGVSAALSVFSMTAGIERYLADLGRHLGVAAAIEVAAPSRHARRAEPR